MKTETFRIVLKIGAAFNFFAAVMVAFPMSLGKIVGLPEPGSLFYPWMLSLAIALYGAIYYWLSVSQVINRAILIFATIGKFGVFLISVSCMLAGEIEAMAVGPAIIDLAFGLIFMVWLVSNRPVKSL